MKRFSFVALICGALCLTSCGAFKSYVASYSVGLSTVESPADAKQQFGETKVVTFNEEGVSKYRYEDDYIDIVWFVGSKQFNFTLKTNLVILSKSIGMTSVMLILKVRWVELCTLV